MKHDNNHNNNNNDDNDNNWSEKRNSQQVSCKNGPTDNKLILSSAGYVRRWMTLSKEALWPYFGFLHSSVITEDVQ